MKAKSRSQSAFAAMPPKPAEPRPVPPRDMLFLQQKREFFAPEIQTYHEQSAKWMARTSPASVPRWDGGNLSETETLVLGSVDGFGDTFLFSRYLLPALTRITPGQIVLSCPEPEAALIASTIDYWKQSEIAPSDVLRRLQLHVTADRSEPVAESDFLSIRARRFSTELSLPASHTVSAAITIAELRFLFGHLPAPQSYLFPYPFSSTTWKTMLSFHSGDRLRVGLCWEAKQDYGRIPVPPAARRSCPASLFAALVASVDPEKVAFYSLVPPAGGVRPREHTIPGALDLTPDFANWEITAAALSNLDLIITVDTAICHLAGAMHIPTWTLIPSLPCWRWGLDPDSCDWYPTMRLFRQQTAGDWTKVIEKIKEELTLRSNADQ